MTVSRYREKIVNVEAETFKGWPGVDALFKWSGGKVYFVPEGEEHPLRHDHERAGGGSAVLHNAPAFLVVSSSKGDLRADINDIIVKQVGDLDVFPMTQEKFTQKYEPRP